MGCFSPINILLLLSAFSLISSLPIDEETPSCGYQSCPPIKEGYINVHLVAHTHDDVGWLKTVDQYYYGLENKIQMASVQNIINSVIDALEGHPSRRFIYVEMAYLWKWWLEQNEERRALIKKLINNGQLEIIGGAWSMNDEAITHYQSIIDQFSWGLRKLNEIFGECSRPKIGWQIDPFGHSNEMASIFAQLGFDAVFLGRIDYQDKAYKFKTSTAEMIWRGSANLGEQSDIFTSVLYNQYDYPQGFCFDSVLCIDRINDEDETKWGYNVIEMVENFLDFLKGMHAVYRTDNLLVTMGGDFNYQNASSTFENIDKLIKYVNERQDEGSKYNLLYSTPSCYLKAVHEESEEKDLKWLVQTSDFFPYASEEYKFWTGYYTSRPTLKRFERVGNNFLQVCKQLAALSDIDQGTKLNVDVLREAMGVMQHHDAVTGTEKQVVAADYAKILSEGFDKCSIATSAALNKLSIDPNSDMEDTKYVNECRFNISECPFTETQDSFVVTVYNPLSRPVNHYVRLPIVDVKFEVLDPEGVSVPSENVPLAKGIFEIPGRQSNATHELLFLAKDLPPLGFKSFYVSRTGENSKSSKVQKTNKSRIEKSANDDIYIYKDKVGFSYSGDTGLLTGIDMNGNYIPMKQHFLFYEGSLDSNDASGAYIFHPTDDGPMFITAEPEIEKYEGNLVSEIHQKYNFWLSQTIRVYKDENFVEFDWIVGPISTVNSSSLIPGHEVITRYTTNLKTNSVFYTDSNGREMLKRVRNFRPAWNFRPYEYVSPNYYPITSKISIRDELNDLEVGVFTDRGQSGSSQNDGEIELMLHRDSKRDDNLGVGEVLQEMAFGKGIVARGSHYVTSGSFTPTLSKSDDADSCLICQQKDIAQRKLLSAWTFLSSTNHLSFEDYKAKHTLQFEGLAKSLPPNVQLLTLEPWTETSFLLRLEHFYEINEHSEFSKPATVDLNNLFTSFEITSIKETTLGANQGVDEHQRLRFNPDSKTVEETVHGANQNSKWKIWNKKSGLTQNQDEDNTYENLEELKVELKPMQIRTFIVDIEKKNNNN